MSGTAPYVYEEVGTDLLAVGQNALVYLYDVNTFSFVVIDEADLFRAGCVTGRYMTGDTLDAPVNSIDVDYPYCRTTIKFRMDDPRSDPQLAQLVALAPFFVIKVILTGCDPNDIKTVSSSITPKQLKNCGAELYPGNVKNEYFVIIDFAAIVTPARLNFTVTNIANVVKTFWIGIRDARDGIPSGALI